MNKIHPTAIIDENAQLGDNIEIGPYCLVGPNVKLGDNTKLVSHVVIDGHTTIGKNNNIFSFAAIGTAPQDLKYKGEPTEVIIGDNNTIREYATINLSAIMGDPTRIGNNNLIMAYAHVAHNCQIGNNSIIANAVNMAGHVLVADFVTIGGLTAIHQFVQIGRYSFVGGASAVKKDVPPFTRGQGAKYEVVGLNSVGLSRKGFSSQTIEAIRRIYKIFYNPALNVSQALAEAEKLPDLCPEQQEFIEFVRNSHRGISR